jgi:protein phosphatase
MTSTSSVMRDAGVIDVVSRSEIGLRRRENQDCCGTWSDADGRRLLVVCDGMGGHRGGAVASAMAVEAIGQHFQSAARGAAGDLLREAFETANRSIHAAAQRDADLDGMGTTGVALLVDTAAPSAEAWVAHVGDSRAYRLRDGALELLTRDHSVGALLGSIGLEEDDAAARRHSHALLRALGSEPEVEVEIQSVSLQPGDCFLLCSDGLWDQVEADPIRSVLVRYPPSEAARILVEEANRRGGPDNITLQIATLPPARRSRARGARVRASRAAVTIAGAAVAVAALLLGLLLALGR